MLAFRSGRVNLLFCTQVGAEGLDFGSCGLIVLFDLPNHLQQYLQCRCASVNCVCLKCIFSRPAASYSWLYKQNYSNLSTHQSMLVPLHSCNEACLLC
jgi:hypothetical protein